MLIDTHCHLNWESYQGELETILQRAHDAGIEKVVTIGVNEVSNKETRLLLEDFEQVYRCVGYHPDIVLEDGVTEGSVNQLMRLLEGELEFEKTVGIGECGLDYYCLQRDGLGEERKEQLKELQKELFERHVLLAVQKGLPLSLHVRDTGEDAYWDVLEILSEYYSPDSDLDETGFSFSLGTMSTQYEKSVISEIATSPTKATRQKIAGVLHCVSGPPEYIQRCIELGFVVSFAGNLTYKNAIDLQELVKTIPLEKIVVETDGPFLSPVPYRGKRNEPAYVVEVARMIAELKHVSYDEVCRVTSDTASKLFRISLE